MAGSRAKRRVAAAAGASSRRRRRKGMLIGGVGIAGILLVVLAGIYLFGGESGADVSVAEGTAPDFSFILYQGEGELGGGKLDFSELQGKPVVLNFWAGLCPPCRAEMPDLQRFYEENQEDVTLVGIDVGRFNGLGNQRDAQNLLRELHITYPAGFTRDGSVIRKYEVLSMPTTVFVDSKGAIFQTWSGLITRDILTEVTAAMLRAEARPS